ncbi:MAG: Crp/Fnr family transcriptional regulator [Deltaproteobacteria bacterium]|nr:Crp/Fnr family transcriptional regulator [Deltaproteobacteria bacterium]
MNPVVSQTEILEKRVAFLEKVALFDQLSRADLEVLAGSFQARKYKKRETVFHQGDDSSVLYVVMKGKVRILSISPAGNETSIRIFTTYDTIGEFAAIDGLPRSATAQTVEETSLLEMSQPTFLGHLRGMPDLAMGMIRLLVGKLRWTTDYAEAIAQYDTAGRLLHMLLHYNEVMGKEIEAGRRYELVLAMTQADLATMVGARREWVNRILQKWRRNGLIEYSHGTITILDLPAVEEERDRRIDLYRDENDW